MLGEYIFRCTPGVLCTLPLQPVVKSGSVSQTSSTGGADDQVFMHLLLMNVFVYGVVAQPIVFDSNVCVVFGDVIAALSVAADKVSDTHGEERRGNSQHAYQHVVLRIV